MASQHYDDDCEYLGDYPHIEKRGEVKVEVHPNEIGILSKSVEDRHRSEDVWIPKAIIKATSYEKQRIGMERAEIEEGITIGGYEHLIRHTVVLVVDDPEGLMPAGFRICLRFRDEYRARMFEKRCLEMIRHQPSGGL